MTPVPAISVTYAHNASASKSNELGMRPIQERAYLPFAFCSFRFGFARAFLGGLQPSLD